MMNFKYITVILVFFMLNISNAEEVIHLKAEEGKDMTMTLRAALENVKDKSVKVVLDNATYLFKPNFAYEKYSFITNHRNGLKKIAFPFQNFENVVIEGNGAALVFHGQILPFLFDHCSAVSVNNLTIDWDIPFTIQGKVMASDKKAQWVDIKMAQKGYSWKLKKGVITFPNIDGYHYTGLGNTLTFDEETKAVAHGALDESYRPEKVEKREDGIYRFYGKMRRYPADGELINFKGPHEENRYAPAFHVISSANVVFDKVVVHHALGMGFLAERSENITIKNSGVYVEKDSDRLISSTADATHFCNVKGKVLIENCRFENMLDDGTNVHGTYVTINKVIDKHSVIIKLEHFQQLGFEFAGSGDEIWLIQAPNPDRGEVLTVKSVDSINDRFSKITFNEVLPSSLKINDILENKTWNPTFTMRGCTIQNHRARNIILKTPLEIIIEDNFLSSSMSSILFRGESFFWFESGQVGDVLIQNNTFYNCATSGVEHAVMYVTPRLGKAFDKTAIYDRNIRFVNNKINTFDNRIVWAYNTSNLLIEGNQIIQNTQKVQLFSEAPMFEFVNCSDISIKKNTYSGNTTLGIKTDKKSKETIEIRKNTAIEMME
ncbi:right-handed parallel beta-helix repeat-containing protein [Flammeovirga pectinis]|uniref:Right-handed parallel beta-helix repeat-containing protein n=2 Tax=Flammeovirga pectinis TaxID=2494373 RepID=A0A3Q9FQM8_9BACT|nr:right-handed parallel beta-helix repeat-containing protein [Flammeovirga pectinis]